MRQHQLATQHIVMMPTLKTALDKLIEGNIEAALNICHFLTQYRPEEMNTLFVRGLATDIRGRNSANIGNYPEAEKDYATAIEDYTRLLDEHPDSYFSTLAVDRRGQLQLALRLLKGAITDFSRVINQEPRNSLAYFHRGQAHFERYNFESAISDLDDAIRLDPDLSDSYELKGMIALLYSDSDSDEKAGYRAAVNNFKKARECFCEDSQTVRLLIYEAAAEYLNENFSAALILLNEVSPSIETLRGREWYELKEKSEILRKYLVPKIEAIEIKEAPVLDPAAQVKTVLERIIYDFLDTPLRLPTVAEV